MAVPQGAELFMRRHHNDILHVLRCLNGELLRDAEDYFGDIFVWGGAKCAPAHP
ncbi:hypothetical protein C8J30_1365 [Rhodobacter viridis]|uniref:Uncharacterized protein n=1 Tax=Rhodobacter viridis TaxID=1054202 RepID=A0A318TQ46_9RHOB|nr:hypothetical protein C8J30_1365 [Rhodobacter viridis]